MSVSIGKITKKYVDKKRDVKHGSTPRMSDGLKIFYGSVSIYDAESGELLAIFLKKILPKNITDIGRKLIAFEGKSDVRGSYAGKKIVRIIKSGKHKGERDMKGRTANSSLVGYLMPYLVKNPKPQLSTTSKKDLTLYEGDLKKLFNYVDRIIKAIDPVGYKQNFEDIKNVPDSIRISKLTTNVQINVNQVAHYHIDSGNKNQYGTILTFYPSGTAFKGGEFILGDYDIGFDLKEGDLLYVNQKSPHGTLPAKGDRLSAVGFQSTKLLNYYDRQKGSGKVSDIVYVIPSYKRKDVLIKKSLSVLYDYYIDKEDIYIFVADEEQLEEYGDVVAMGYNVIIAKKGLTNARNFIIDYFKEGQKIVALDDDISDIEKMISKTKLKPIDNLKRFITNGFKELEKQGLQLGGVYASRNPYYMKNNISTDLKYIVGAFYFFINDKSQKINPIFDLCEDYARTIKSFIKYGGVLRYNYITIKTSYYTSEGGLADYRKGKIKGKTPEEISKTALYNKYPNYIRPIIKKGQFDIALKKISSIE